MVVTPTQFTLNAGDWACDHRQSVEESYENGAPSRSRRSQPSSSTPRTRGYRLSRRGSLRRTVDTLYTTCTPNQHASHRLRHPYCIITTINNVSATTLLTIHPRAGITLSADSSSLNSAFWPGSAEPWPTTTNTVGAEIPSTNCISQGNQVQYIAHAVDANGNPISSCSLSVTAGCVNNNDYTWSAADSTVASVSTYGFVVARNPGVDQCLCQAERNH